MAVGAADKDANASGRKPLVYPLRAPSVIPLVMLRWNIA